MEFFETHAHYNDEKFECDMENVLMQLKEEGVTSVVVAGYSLESSKKAIEIANARENFFATCGISPNDINENWQNELKEIENLANNEKVVAVGEIGLDYYWNKENKQLQKEVFIKQIEIANRLEKPIQIHSRDAWQDTIAVLKQNKVNKKGIFHCCQLNQELVKNALELDYIISFAGPITFKNSKNADEIIKMVPNDKFIIETDSPYLAPEPVRGTRNNSCNLKYIAQKIANVKQMPVEEVAKIAYENARRVFEI